MAPRLRKEMIAGGRDNAKGLIMNRIIAGVEIGLLSLAFYMWVHFLHGHHSTGNGHVVLLFPLSAVAYFASILPLFMYISYTGDFEGVNPLNPLHYLFLSRKFYAALQQNNMKVSSKEL